MGETSTLNTLHKAIRETIAVIILDETDDESNETIDAVFKNRRFRTKMRGMIHEIIVDEAKNLDLESIQREMQEQRALIQRLQKQIQRRKRG